MNAREKAALANIEKKVPDLQAFEKALLTSVETRYLLVLAVMLGLLSGLLANIIYNEVILTFGNVAQVIYKSVIIVLFPICIFLLYRSMKKYATQYNEIRDMREFAEKYIQLQGKKR